MFKLSPRTAVATVVIVLGVVAIFAALARPLNEFEKSADGLTAYLGVTPAAVMKGRQTMHGGTSSGPHEYHIEAAIFDKANTKRVSDAIVTARVLGLGLSGQEAKLEAMNIADATTYGAFVYLPGVDIYTIELTIQRVGSQQPVILDFNYDHSRQ